MKFTSARLAIRSTLQPRRAASLLVRRSLVGAANEWPDSHRRIRRFGDRIHSAASHQSPDREEDKIRRLEAVLFLAREPLGSRKLSEFARLEDGTQARTLIRKLNEKFDRSHRPYRIRKVAEGFQLMTRPQFARWLRRLQERQAPTPPLTPPALETLTVIAYRQPIVKAEIEAIRGVGCSDILRQLMERDMVRISGRSSDLGRPFLYSTTKNFLRTFGLSGLDALPRADQLRGMGLPSWASPLNNQDSQPNEPIRALANPEESNVTLSSSSLSVEDLDAKLNLGMAAAFATAAPSASKADDDDDLDEEDAVDDDEEEDDEEEAEEDDDDAEWEEIEDDEDWDDEEDDDEEWDDDDEDEDEDDDDWE